MTQNLAAATSLLPQTLAVTQPSTANTETTAYTVPVSSSLKVASGTLCNTTAAPIVVNLSVVPTGGTAGTSNRVIASYSLAAYQTLSLAGFVSGALMGPGDFISRNDSATGVTLVLTGTVNS